MLILDNILKQGNHGSYGDPHPQYHNLNNLLAIGGFGSGNGWYKIGQLKFDSNIMNTTASLFDIRFLLNFDLIYTKNYDTSNSEFVLNYTLSLYHHQDGTKQVILKRHTEFPVNLNFPNMPLLLLDVVTPLSTGGFQANLYYYCKDFSGGNIYVDLKKKTVLTDRYVRDSSKDMVSFVTPTLFTGAFTSPYYETISINQPIKTTLSGASTERYLQLFSFSNGSDHRTMINFTFDDRETTQNLTLKVTNPGGTFTIKGKQGIVYGTNRIFYILTGSTVTVYAKIPQYLPEEIMFKVNNFYSSTSSLKLVDFRYDAVRALNLYDAASLTGLTAFPDA